MRSFILAIPVVVFASARGGAQTTTTSRPGDTTCSYDACALSIAPAWDGLHVVRGSTRERVANLHFFWPTDVDDVLRGADPAAIGADSAAAHARRALQLRQAGAGFTDAGALALGAALLRAIATGHASTRTQVIAGVGLGALPISVPLQFGADGELSRAVWWHNLRFAAPRNAAAVALGTPVPAVRPRAASLAGTWDIEYTLDTANAQAAAPTVRRVRGRLMFGDAGTDSIHGRFDVDFAPLFGGSLNRDITAAAGPVDSTLVTEIAGTLAGADSLQIDLVPRVAAAGISMSGRIRGDSASGTWIRRAACCGEIGHFRMTRVDRTPVVLGPVR